MSAFTRKLALIAAVVLVPAGLALGAVAIGSDTGAPRVRVEDATVDMHAPPGQQGRTSSSSSPTTNSSPTPISSPGEAPAPARPVPVQPVQPVVPYYGDDRDDDWDDGWDDDGDDWDDDWDD